MDVLFRLNWSANPPPKSNPHYHLLTSQGSLTELIRSECRHEFSVRVLKHAFLPASDLAAHALGLSAGAPVLYREVLLCDGDQARVFASSILPLSALTGRFAPLRELGARPLGHWIFAEPQLTRRQMHFAECPPDDNLFGDHCRLSLPASGRRTFFAGAERDFLVNEFFLTSD